MLSTSIRSMIEEKEMQIRKATFSICGNRGLLSWINGNSIKTKEFNPLEIAQTLKDYKLIQDYEVKNELVELITDPDLETIEYGADGRPIQKFKKDRMNWDAIIISEDTATQMAAIEEIPIKGLPFWRYIKRGIKKGLLLRIA